MQATLFITLFALGAPTLKDKPDPGGDLYGLWELERTEGVIVKAGPPIVGPLRYKFNKDGTWVVFDGDKEIAGPRPFKIDGKANPIAIDTNTIQTASKGTVVYGIFKVEGDKLTLCKAYPGDVRPKAFSVPDGSSNVLMVFRRVKSKD